MINSFCYNVNFLGLSLDPLKLIMLTVGPILSTRTPAIGDPIYRRKMATDPIQEISESE